MVTQDLYFIVFRNGHPFGYYLFQYFLICVFDSRFIFGLVNLLFTVGSVFLLASSGIFSITQRLLFPFGFFIVYQYGVVVRGYSYLIFFLFLYCWLRERRPAMTNWSGLCLMIICQIHFFGCIASAANLIFELLTEYQKYTSTKCFKMLIVSRLAVLTVLIFTVLQVYTSSESGLNQLYFPLLLARFANAMVPEIGILYNFRELAISGCFLCAILLRGMSEFCWCIYSSLYLS